MKKLLLLFLFITFSLRAEIIIETGKHRHVGDISNNQSCKIAEQKAKKNAIIKSIGQTVSSNVVSNCSDVDGEFECERNQISLFELKGEITSSRRGGKAKYGEELGSEGVFFCEVTIKANVEPIKKNLDPNFHFDIKLNRNIFRTGEDIKLDINVSKKMYMTIFQWLPYGGKQYDVITKIFPNEKFNKKITNNLIEDNLKLTYQTYFPEEIKKNKVDEYFIFVASEKNINWLNEYAEIESLKKQFQKTNVLMEKHYSGYMIIR